MPGADGLMMRIYAATAQKERELISQGNQGGATVARVQAHLLQMDQVEVLPDLISRMTDAVHEDVLAWRRRPLEPVYPLVFLDATIIVYSVPNKPAGPPRSG